MLSKTNWNFWPGLFVCLLTDRLISSYIVRKCNTDYHKSPEDPICQAALMIPFPHLHAPSPPPFPKTWWHTGSYFGFILATVTEDWLFRKTPRSGGRRETQLKNYSKSLKSIVGLSFLDLYLNIGCHFGCIHSYFISEMICCMLMDIHLWLKVLLIYHGSAHDFNIKTEEVASFRGQSSGSNAMSSTPCDIILWNSMAS